MPPAPAPSVTVILAKIMTAPAVLYCVFFAIRLGGYQPEAEAGLGDFLTALFFIAGAAICYFVFAAYAQGLVQKNQSGVLWWWLSAALLLLLAFDEIYMIHENLSGALEIREQYIFLLYAAMLGALLWTNRGRALKRAPIFFFFLFAVFAGISVVADALFHEGVIHAFGRELDYEQLTESVSAIFLSCGFASMALVEMGMRPLANPE